MPLSEAYFVGKTSIKIQKACHDLIPNLSVHFDEHFSSTFKLMINIYICVRSKYFAKDTNIEMKKNQTRQKLNRLVLFRHLQFLFTAQFLKYIYSTLYMICSLQVLNLDSSLNHFCTYSKYLFGSGILIIRINSEYKEEITSFFRGFDCRK